MVGDGAALCYEKLKEHIPAIQIAAPENRLQRAASVATCAYRRAGEAIDAAALTMLFGSELQRDVAFTKRTHGQYLFIREKDLRFSICLQSKLALGIDPEKM